MPDLSLAEDEIAINERSIAVISQVSQAWNATNNAFKKLAGPRWGCWTLCYTESRELCGNAYLFIRWLRGTHHLLRIRNESGSWLPGHPRDEYWLIVGKVASSIPIICPQLSRQLELVIQ